MKNKLNINVFMYLLISIMLIVLVNDYITYFFKINYAISILLSTIIIIYPLWMITKKIKITKNFNKSDIVFYMILFAIMITTIPFADRAFDTYNYHLYLQENPFGNKLNADLFAGKIFNTYSYAFPDRLFYLFRYIFGYRLGLLLNYFLMVILYYQVKNIVKHISAKEEKKKELVVSLISTFSITSLAIIDIIDSYYIDIISIVLLLESLTIALFSERLKRRDPNNNYLFGYLGLLFGLSFAVKISNAIPIIVIFIIFIFKHRNFWKCLNIKNITLTILLFFFPFIIYMTYTYMQTGNPFFPFYNTLFKSKYFANTNWMDTRFGPNRFLGVLAWPIIIMIKPIRCVDTAVVEPMWCIGYIVSILYILHSLIRMVKKEVINDERLVFSIITVIMYLIWAKFLLGYSRYGLIVLVLAGINTFMILQDAVKNKKYFIIGLLIISLLYNYAYSGYNYMFNKQDWIYNNSFNNELSNYQYNVNNLFFRENKLFKFKKNSAWAVVYDNSALLQSLNDEIPMINLYELKYLREKSKYKNEQTIEMIQKRLEKYENIYSAVDSVDLNIFLKSLNLYGYKISKVEDVITSNQLPKNNYYVYIFKIEKDLDANNYEETFNKEYTIDVKNKNNKKIYIGNSKMGNHIYSNDYYAILYGKNNDKKTKIETFKVSRSGDMISFNLNSLGNYESFIIDISTKEKKKKEEYWATILIVDD